MAKVTLISPVACETRIDAVLDEPGATVRCWDDQYTQLDPVKVVEECAGADLAAVCVGPEVPIQAAIAIAGAFDRERPECSVLLVAEAYPGLWEAALRAGVRELVSPGATSDELARSLGSVLAVAERRRATLAEGQRRAETARACRIITVVSPKGGSGKTTVATNLAVGLARTGAGASVLVDLDLQFGDVASALQLAPEQTLADVARAPRDFDATMLKVFLAAHPSGVYALAAPHTPPEADEVIPAHVTHALDLLRSEFAFVVVDTGAGLDTPSLAAIEASTDLVLVSAMDVATVRSLRKELDVLERLTLTGARRHLVLNRSDSKVGMDAADIESVLGLPVDVSVPSSRLVPVSTNEGTPLLEGTLASPTAKALVKLVARFADVDAPESGLATGRRRRRGRR